MSREQDLSGRVVGRLTVLQRIDHRWECACSCGGKSLRATGELNQAAAAGSMMSCGCARREHAAALGAAKRKHGLSTSKLKSVRTAMISRCTKPHNPDYHRYGGRGIAVCAEWLNSATSFYAWALAAGWQPGLSIERINSDGDYEPSNCTFIPIGRQAANISRNRKLTHNGSTKTAADWSRELGIAYRCLIARLDRGWPVERALQP